MKPILAALHLRGWCGCAHPRKRTIRWMRASRPRWRTIPRSPSPAGNGTRRSKRFRRRARWTIRRSAWTRGARAPVRRVARARRVDGLPGHSVVRETRFARQRRVGRGETGGDGLADENTGGRRDGEAGLLRSLAGAARVGNQRAQSGVDAAVCRGRPRRAMRRERPRSPTSSAHRTNWPGSPRIASTAMRTRLQALAELNQLLRRAPGTPVEIGPEVTAPVLEPGVTLDQLQAAAEERPELLGLREGAVRSAEAALALAKKGYDPDVQVRVEAWQYEGKSGIQEYDVGVSINFPWLNRGKYRAAIDEARANLDASRDELDAMRVADGRRGEETLRRHPRDASSLRLVHGEADPAAATRRRGRAGRLRDGHGRVPRRVGCAAHVVRSGNAEPASRRGISTAVGVAGTNGRRPVADGAGGGEEMNRELSYGGDAIGARAERRARFLRPERSRRRYARLTIPTQPRSIIVPCIRRLCPTSPAIARSAT